MQVFGPRELIKDVHDKGLCVACGACVDLCPYFRSHRGKVAMVFPCDLPSGRCHAFCPKAEVDLDALAQHSRGKPYTGDPLGHYIKIMTGRAGEKGPAGPFQAGGTVSSLVAFALKQGVIDAAVLTDREGMIPVPRVVTQPKEVAACASSKYTAAPTLSALHHAVRKGYPRIGVVGTPCQATALAQMRMNPLRREDFSDHVALVVGLFCTWALDTRGLGDLLSQKLDPGAIRKMDIPPPPSEKMVIETLNGKLEIPLSEIRPLVPKGCLLCPDMTAEWADISVGVLESDPTRNTLLIRTERGMGLVDRALKRGWLEAGPMPEESREHLAFAAANKRRRALQRAGEQGLLNTEGETRACLRLNSATLAKILAGS
jgi:coenzyme F420 hydrogenase subunit beta